MITKKSREEIKLMKMAGDIVAQVHFAMKSAVRPGVSTKELDDIAFDIIKKIKQYLHLRVIVVFQLLFARLLMMKLFMAFLQIREY